MYCFLSQVASETVVPKSVSQIWESLTPDVRAALIASELNNSDGKTSTSISGSTPSRNFSSASLSDQTSSLGSSHNYEAAVSYEKCPVSGAQVKLSALERAPNNVFAFTKTHFTEKSEVTKTSNATVTTTTKVVSTSRGWRNIFSLPISYDVNMVSHGTLFDPMNSQMLDATGVHPEGYNTRFAVVDVEVDKLYGEQIRSYFTKQGIELKVCLVNGGEADKRSQVSCDVFVFMFVFTFQLNCTFSLTCILYLFAKIKGR